MKLIFILVVVWMLLVSASATEHVNENNCEKLAKDWQQTHYGSLVFIQPLTESGAYNLGEYTGHWLNHYWNGTAKIYYDAGTGTPFLTKQEVKEWYLYHCEVFDLADGHPPFPLTWHY
jgi:hypothetical protein